jgi:hypothetical protein
MTQYNYADYSDYNTIRTYGVTWGTLVRKVRSLQKQGLGERAAWETAKEHYQTKHKTR